MIPMAINSSSSIRPRLRLKTNHNCPAVPVADGSAEYIAGTRDGRATPAPETRGTVGKITHNISEKSKPRNSSACAAYPAWLVFFFLFRLLLLEISALITVRIFPMGSSMNGKSPEGLVCRQIRGPARGACALVVAALPVDPGYGARLL
jgi:hypothetical protein